MEAACQYALLMPEASPLSINRQDYEAMREGPPYYQVVEGDLIMSPSPGSFHQSILGRLYLLIAGFLENHPLGKVFMAPLDVFLNDINVYQPDMLFVSKEHLSRIVDHGIEGAPDLVVEIMSPRTSIYDRGSKRKVYAQSGVREMWLIDPEKKRIEIFHLQEDPEAPWGDFGPRSRFTSPLFPGLIIDCARVFKR